MPIWASAPRRRNRSKVMSMPENLMRDVPASAYRDGTPQALTPEEEALKRELY